MLDRQSLAELADMYKEKYNLALKDNEELERQIDEANAEVEQLRAERDEARKRLKGRVRPWVTTSRLNTMQA